MISRPCITVIVVENGFIVAYNPEDQESRQFVALDHAGVLEAVKSALELAEEEPEDREPGGSVHQALQREQSDHMRLRNQLSNAGYTFNRDGTVIALTRPDDE